MKQGLFTYGRWLRKGSGIAIADASEQKCPEDVAEQFQARRDHIAQMEPSTYKNQQRFFCELDWGTHPCALMLQPNLPRRDERIVAGASLPAVLQRRVLMRARAARAPGYEAPGDLPRTDAGQTALVADSLAACIQEHFTNPETPGGANRVAQGFANFASGALRHEPRPGVWTCEPDGPFYFFFAEFAWAALEHGIREQLWLGILHGLISSQFLYAQAYFDSTHLVRRSFDEASRDHCFSKAGMPSRRARDHWTFVNATRSKDELSYESCRRAAEFFL